MCARYPYLGLNRIPRAADYAAIATALSITETECFRHRPIATLSGGERQRVYLAMALAQETETVLLDEPTAYLDAAAAFETAAILQRMRSKGHTVAAVIHDLPLALSVADRIVLLQEGRCVFVGPPEEAVSCGALSHVFGIAVHRHPPNTYVITPQTP